VATGIPEIDGLLAAKKVFEARDRLESLKLSGRPIYGIDQQLEQVSTVAQRADASITSAKQQLAEGHPRLAAHDLNLVTRFASDHPELPVVIEEVNARLTRARELKREATTAIQTNRLRKALGLLRECLELDPESRSARQLLVEAENSSSQRRQDRSYLSVLIATVTVIVFILTVVGLVVFAFSDPWLEENGQQISQTSQELVPVSPGQRPFSVIEIAEPIIDKVGNHDLTGTWVQESFEGIRTKYDRAVEELGDIKSMERRADAMVAKEDYASAVSSYRSTLELLSAYQSTDPASNGYRTKLQKKLINAEAAWESVKQEAARVAEETRQAEEAKRQREEEERRRQAEQARQRRINERRRMVAQYSRTRNFHGLVNQAEALVAAGERRPLRSRLRRRGAVGRR